MGRAILLLLIRHTLSILLILSLRVAVATFRLRVPLRALAPVTTSVPAKMTRPFAPAQVTMVPLTTLNEAGVVHIALLVDIALFLRLVWALQLHLFTAKPTCPLFRAASLSRHVAFASLPTQLATLGLLRLKANALRREPCILPVPVRTAASPVRAILLATELAHYSCPTLTNPPAVTT